MIFEQLNVTRQHESAVVSYPYRGAPSIAHQTLQRHRSEGDPDP